MRTRAERRVAARYRWDRLKVSFWFAPALMALGSGSAGVGDVLGGQSYPQ